MPLHEISELETMWHGDMLWKTRAEWCLGFCWLPKRCAISNKILWLTMAYRGRLMITGPGEPIIEYRYHDTHEHLIWLLKN